MLAIPFLLYNNYTFYRYKNYIVINKAPQYARWYNKQLEETQIPNLFDNFSEFGFKYTLIDDHNWIYEIKTPDLWTVNFSQWFSSISSLFTKNPFTKITINNSLYYTSRNLKRLPWCPNVTGHFDCSDNPELKSLVGSPGSVGSIFDCRNCNLTSLKGGPKVADDYYASNNHLINLIGSPKTVIDFYCDDNPKLTSLEGAPKIINGSFLCRKNPNLKSLKGCPKEVGGFFYCKNTPLLKSLRGLENSKIKTRINYDKKNMDDQREARQIESLAIRNYT